MKSRTGLAVIGLIMALAGAVFSFFIPWAGLLIAIIGLIMCSVSAKSASKALVIIGILLNIVILLWSLLLVALSLFSSTMKLF